jgi:hypothetical protein
MTNKRGSLVEDLEVFAWLEADGLAGGDGDLGAGAGVAADAGFAGLYGEDAEAAELDAVAGAEGGLHGLKDGVDGGFGLGAGEAGTFHYSLDEILLDQFGGRLPEMSRDREVANYQLETAYTAMVEMGV